LLRQCTRSTKQISTEADRKLTDFEIWQPLLIGLKDITINCDLEIRNSALQLIFDILMDLNVSFSKKFWGTIVNDSIYPLFQIIKSSSGTKRDESQMMWISTTLIQGFRKLLDLFCTRLNETRFMLPEILELLSISILDESEVLNRIGIVCIEQLVERNTLEFKEEEWNIIAASLCDLFTRTAPKFLFFELGIEGMEEEYAKWTFLDGLPPPVPKNEEFNQQLPKCMTHLMIIETVHNLLKESASASTFDVLPYSQLIRIINCFKESFYLAEIFNMSIDLRKAIYAKGFMNQMPNLLRQETLCAVSYTSALFRLYKKGVKLYDNVPIENILIPYNFLNN
jgi:brefeldin A-inhibited guanine nucleotide-exchange protein